MSGGSKKQFLGKAGEQAAIDFLRRQGCRIIEKNFRARSGEIDIIAEHQGVLAFVEVKTRASLACGGPMAALTPAKRRRIESAARLFLAQRQITNQPCRFDVITIAGEEGQKDGWRMEWFPGAFRPQTRR